MKNGLGTICRSPPSFLLSSSAPEQHTQEQPLLLYTFLSMERGKCGMSSAEVSPSEDPQSSFPSCRWSLEIWNAADITAHL